MNATIPIDLDDRYFLRELRDAAIDKWVTLDDKSPVLIESACLFDLAKAADALEAMIARSQAGCVCEAADKKP